MSRLQQLRDAHPDVAAFADDIRAAFPEAKVVYLRDGDWAIGTPAPEGVTPTPKDKPVERYEIDKQGRVKAKRKKK